MLDTGGRLTFKTPGLGLLLEVPVELSRATTSPGALSPGPSFGLGSALAGGGFLALSAPARAMRAHPD